jgi:hypothetical protein
MDGGTAIINLRQIKREEVFQRLDAIPIELLRHATWTRAAAMADTTITFVQLWVATRGYQGLIGKPKRRRKAAKKQVYQKRATTPQQRQRLRLIARLLTEGTTWEAIGRRIGISRQAAHQFWQLNRHRLDDSA